MATVVCGFCCLASTELCTSFGQADGFTSLQLHKNVKQIVDEAMVREGVCTLAFDGWTALKGSPRKQNPFVNSGGDDILPSLSGAVQNAGKVCLGGITQLFAGDQASHTCIRTSGCLLSVRFAPFGIFFGNFGTEFPNGPKWKFSKTLEEPHQRRFHEAGTNVELTLRSRLAHTG